MVLRELGWQGWLGERGCLWGLLLPPTGWRLHRHQEDDRPEVVSIKWRWQEREGFHFCVAKLWHSRGRVYSCQFLCQECGKCPWVSIVKSEDSIPFALLPRSREIEWLAITSWAKCPMSRFHPIPFSLYRKYSTSSARLYFPQRALPQKRGVDWLRRGFSFSLSPSTERRFCRQKKISLPA